MRKILIIGAGGFGREVMWLIHRINKNSPTYEIIGFIDDAIPVGTKIDCYEVCGTLHDISVGFSECSLCIAIGNPNTRKKIVKLIGMNDYDRFPNIIDPSVEIDENRLGIGNIICANNLLTVDYKIGSFTVLNLACTVGHDAIISDFVTIYPGVNVSGNVILHTTCEIGTGSKLIQGVEIGSNTVLGAGSVVTKNIPGNVLAAGVPAQIKKERNVDNE